MHNLTQQLEKRLRAQVRLRNAVAQSTRQATVFQLNPCPSSWKARSPASHLDTTPSERPSTSTASESTQRRATQTPLAEIAIKHIADARQSPTRKLAFAIPRSDPSPTCYLQHVLPPLHSSLLLDSQTPLQLAPKHRQFSSTSSRTTSFRPETHSYLRGEHQDPQTTVRPGSIDCLAPHCAALLSPKHCPRRMSSACRRTGLATSTQEPAHLQQSAKKALQLLR